MSSDGTARVTTRPSCFYGTPSTATVNIEVGITLNFPNLG